MNAEFFCAVFLCLSVPVLLGKCCRIQRLFPLAFLQLLFGLLLNASGLSQWLQLQGIHLLQGSLAASLNGLGWMGLALLIALTGSESSPLETRQQAWHFIPISVFGFGVTCTLGSVFGYQIASQYPALLGQKQDVLVFALAMGLSLSVTALPVLIVVLRDNHLAESVVGKLAINCALLDDVWLWLVLAMILSQSTLSLPLHQIVLWLILYIVVMFAVVRPLLRYVFVRYVTNDSTDGLLLSISLICLSAISTDLMGLHAILGAYIAGVVLPREAWGRTREAIMHFVQIFLLPFFFVLTGMRLSIPVDEPFFWQLTAMITLVATGCKFCSVTLAGHWIGLAWREAAILGTLMQCKGLMELVAINILFEAGIISLQIFSALAMMALISTFITAPVMRVLLAKQARVESAA